MRGEQAIKSLPPQRQMGSPPLARGTAKYLSAFAHAARITPACAGNSGQTYAVIGCVRDHPRLRGEQRPLFHLSFPCGGSPPLARGTEILPRAFRVPNRITPACAGNSLVHQIRMRVSRDHPRLRGEQTSKNSLSCNSPGSPPLARGTALFFPALTQ